MKGTETMSASVEHVVKNRVSYDLQPSKYLCADVDDDESVRQPLRHGRANPLDATPRATPTTPIPRIQSKSSSLHLDMVFRRRHLNIFYGWKGYKNAEITERKGRGEKEKRN